MSETLVLDDVQLKELKLELSGLILRAAGRCQSHSDRGIRRAKADLRGVLPSHLAGDVRGLITSRNKIIDPKEVSDELKSVERAISKIKAAREACEGFPGNELLLLALNDAESEASRRIRILSEFLPKGGLRRGKRPDFAALQVAIFAAYVFRSWTGEEIHSRSMTFRKHQEKRPPPDLGFPTFVDELFELLEINVDWRSPTECATRDWDGKSIDISKLELSQTE